MHRFPLGREAEHPADPPGFFRANLTDATLDGHDQSDVDVGEIGEAAHLKGASLSRDAKSLPGALTPLGGSGLRHDGTGRARVTDSAPVSEVAEAAGSEPEAIGPLAGIVGLPEARPRLAATDLVVATGLEPFLTEQVGKGLTPRGVGSLKPQTGALSAAFREPCVP
ncbi:hypothetical protein [Methylobacterium nigriterrae]|uniref:hypothetical protein n=1 Tax=Methylobacterium nigriterrae TaxID=3127512 RepID=UPI003013FFD6